MPGLVLLCEETVSVDDPDPPGDKETVNGLRVGTGPDGEMLAVSDRLPVSPLILVKDIVELEDVPAGTDRDPGLAEIVKSTTWTVTWTE